MAGPGSVAMREKQQGITAIGFLIIATMVALIGYAALRLTPIYLEQMKIVRVLEDVKAEFDGQNASIAYIRAGIGKRLNVEMVTVLKLQDFTIKKSERGYVIRAQYENRAPYVANIYLLAVFNTSVEIVR
jgi:hypothetical protein